MNLCKIEKASYGKKKSRSYVIMQKLTVTAAIRNATYKTAEIAKSLTPTVTDI
jgi:hypothetical protein